MTSMLETVVTSITILEKVIKIEIKFKTKTISPFSTLMHFITTDNYVVVVDANVGVFSSWTELHQS